MPRRRRRRFIKPKGVVRRRVLRVVAVVLAVGAVIVGGFLAIVTALEYRPADSARLTVERAEAGSEILHLAPGDTLTVLTFNVGYAGLGKGQDAKADGGAMITVPQDDVAANLEGILAALASHTADAMLLQQVDTGSRRSAGIDQAGEIHGAFPAMASVFAPDYRSSFVPYPIPPTGRIDSGMLTLTPFKPAQATRLALPTTLSWPKRLFQPRPCLLVARIPVGSTRELVLVNVHLPATTDDGDRSAHIEALRSLVSAEYSSGNYVVVGGSFGSSFPGAGFPEVSNRWVPPTLEIGPMVGAWTLATGQGATARLADKPWDGTNQLFAVDGFFASPNVELSQVAVVDLGFEHSSHNPVTAVATLK